MTTLKLNCNAYFPRVGDFMEVECDNESGVFKVLGNKYYSVHSAVFDGKKRADSKRADILLINGETLKNICLEEISFVGKCPITYSGKGSDNVEPATQDDKEEKGGFFS